MLPSILVLSVKNFIAFIEQGYGLPNKFQLSSLIVRMMPFGPIVPALVSFPLKIDGWHTPLKGVPVKVAV